MQNNYLLTKSHVELEGLGYFYWALPTKGLCRHMQIITFRSVLPSNTGLQERHATFLEVVDHQTSEIGVD